MTKQIDWLYFRKGWTSCTKASKFIEASKIEITETIPASRKLQREDALKLLKKANKLTVAKGKKVVEFSGKDKTSEDAVTAMLGSTGNLRAPTALVGKDLLVGFNEEAYQSVLA